MENYQFVFVMYLMRRLLGITNELSLALQQKNQNIAQAMSLIEAVRVRLQDFREMGWEVCLEKVSFFYLINLSFYSELLLLVSYLDPRDSFSKFNIDKLLHFAELYPEDFTMTEYFINIRDLGGFARKMVETGKSLALVLLVTTTSVERVFSVMNVVKTNLRNKMKDELMNDSLRFFASIDNEAILQHFQKSFPYIPG
ncbi:Ribonuclease H-like protein [Dioscorea alata]|uniref:Ribonuclease H-like protein n=1 Tax=Dioscorea alata TaxID=55571 RepID=A0ACB7WTE0_DIOAL|nr:Ribonuclease H-like protein [Dioscorea alata]